jgi:hypothetical protein
MFRVTAMGQFPPFADLTRRSLTRALGRGPDYVITSLSELADVLPAS